MTDLTAMGPLALHNRLVASPFYLDLKQHPGDNIVATFQGLSTQFEDDPAKLKAQDKRDLFECCLYLTVANTFQVGDQARGRLIELIQKYPKFNFRPEGSAGRGG